MANPYTQNSVGFMPTDMQTDQIENMRQRKMAEELLKQSQQPINGQMVSGIYVPPSWTQYLAQGLKAYMGGQGVQEANKREHDLADAVMRKKEEWLSQMPQAQPERQVPQFDASKPYDQAPTMQTIPASNPTSADYLKWAMGGMNVDPNSAQMGMKYADLQEARQARMDQMKAQQEERQASEKRGQEFKREMQQQNFENQQTMARMAAGMRQPQAPTLATVADPKDPSKSIIIDAKTNRVIGNAPGDKNAKLPSSALKLQQEELDALSTSSNINADIGAIKQQVDTGKLILGPIENQKSKLKNFAGASDENSRNYATFQANLEKMRNDSLRLNKGVQTEGDAVRAWNELLSNINDKDVVSKRLGEIQKINERAANIRRMNIDTIRSNFGVGPFQDPGYSNPKPAVTPAGSIHDQADAILRGSNGNR